MVTGRFPSKPVLSLGDAGGRVRVDLRWLRGVVVATVQTKRRREGGGEERGRRKGEGEREIITCGAGRA